VTPPNKLTSLSFEFGFSGHHLFYIFCWKSLLRQPSYLKFEEESEKRERERKKRKKIRILFGNATLEQVNFSGPKIFAPQILVIFKIKNLATSNFVEHQGKVAPGRAGVRKPPAGLGWGMLHLSRKVRLVKVYLSSNYKDFHDVNVFSQGPLKLNCAAIFDI